MKKTVLLIALITVGLTGFAQNNSVDKLFDKYSGKDGFTTIYISSRMFSLIAGANLEDEEMEDLMSKLKSIRILTVEDEELNQDLNFFKELNQSLDFSKYEELMRVKEGGNDLIFLIKEKGDRIEELLMVGGGDGMGNNVLLSIKGDLDLENISEISHQIGIEELDGIDKKRTKKDEE